MKKNNFSSFILLFTVSLTIFAQEPDSTPENKNQPTDEKTTKMQQEIDFLKKQMALESAKSDLTKQRIDNLRAAIPKSSVELLKGNTTYADEKEKNFESISLSYEALKEISVKISADLQKDFSPYSGLVLYHEPDFTALGKYRLYRSQARIALQNYQALIELLKKLTFPATLPDPKLEGKFRIKNTDPLMTALSIPSLGTSYATSIAELFSAFRTDTNITQTESNIDETSLGVVMANEIRKNNPGLKIYFPQAFVAEYNLEEEGEDSLFGQITKINAANFMLDEILRQINLKFPPEGQIPQDVKDVKTMVELVKRQLQSLAIENNLPAAEGENNVVKTPLSEFRQLVRAEKLDHFLENKSPSTAGKVSSQKAEGEKIGILKLRVLSSGGSRRERKNIFLGSKTDFSGSVVVEIILFDADGSLQKSDVYSLHTGFRKMQRNENPK